MGQFQHAVNSLAHTAALATYGLETTVGADLDADTNENVNFSNQDLKEKQAQEAADAQTNIDQAVVNRNLADKEFQNPSKNNKSSFKARAKNMSEADKAVQAAITAQKNLTQTQNLQTALRQDTNDQIKKLQKQGLLGKVKANKLSWNEL